jgi:hypothetical protein
VKEYRNGIHIHKKWLRQEKSYLRRRVVMKLRDTKFREIGTGTVPVSYVRSRKLRILRNFVIISRNFV